MFVCVNESNDMVVEVSAVRPANVGDGVYVVRAAEGSVPQPYGDMRVFHENGNFILKNVAPLQKRIERAVQKTLDETARDHGYDSILSACSYAAYDNPYQTEGRAFLAWRGAVWKYCYDQLAAIENGDRNEPASVEDFIAELPEYTPPS